jgi:serine protease SohB
MSAFIAEYGLFLAKTITIILAIIGTIVGIVILLSRTKEISRERLEITKLNDKFEEMADTVQNIVLEGDQLKKFLKDEKKRKKRVLKEQKSDPSKQRKRIFVLNFDGDIKASPLKSLREEITAILTVATPEDEVFLSLQSGGGLVHAYGLAASQLMRIKNRNITLTIAVDKIAASGGYMMACVADRIIAAPFSIIGSIGVIAQIPNFHRLLKKHDIDFEQMTAGEFKRTLTVFGENTDKAREKFQEELEETHTLFKQFIQEHRPIVDVERIATGEHWPAKIALDLKLVDELKTSDDFLLEKSADKDLYKVEYSIKRSIGMRLGWFIRKQVESLFMREPAS